MHKINQTKLSDPVEGLSGNCLAACVASILDLQLKQVPEFERYGDKRNLHLVEFMESQGYEFNETIHLSAPNYKREAECLLLLEELTKSKQGIDGFFIVVGLSPRGIRHGCVYSQDGLIHDPHPSNRGLCRVDYIWVFTRREIIMSNNIFENK